MAASNAQCEQLDRLVWGLMRGNIAGWTSPEVVAALAGAASCWRLPSSPGNYAHHAGTVRVWNLSPARNSWFCTATRES